MPQFKRQQESAQSAAAELSLYDKLEAIAELVKLAKDREKEAKQQMLKARGQFFALADEVIEKEQYPLPTKVVSSASYEADYKLDWKILQDDGETVTIQKNPSFMKFSHELVDLGISIDRIISHVKQELDLVRLRQRCYDEINKTPTNFKKWNELDACIKPVVSYELDEERVELVLSQYPELQPVVQSYITQGELQTKLMIKKLEEE